MKTPMQELCDSLLHQMNTLDRDNSKLRQEHYVLKGVYDFAKTLIQKEQEYTATMKAEWQREIIDVLGKLLSGDSGCPMCDNGVLRDNTKQHWDDCVWNNARLLYNKYLNK